jgi:AraC-like DNA-binding protein
MMITTNRVDSPLGSWTHHEARSARLAHVVDHMWHFDGRTSLPRERLFPGGYLEIILHLGPRFSDVDARGTTLDEFPLACITGMMTRPAVIEAPAGNCCVFGIRLRPVGAWALFGDAACETVDRTIDLGDLDRSDLAARCYEAGDVTARFACAEQWMLTRLARATTPVKAVVSTASRIERSDGNASITSLRSETGLSRARFVDVFRRHTGLTPKRYARMLRFHRALKLIQGGRSLSDVAVHVGYFDQSHLTADFREFAAMTPGEFLRSTRYPGSASISEA